MEHHQFGGSFCIESSLQNKLKFRNLVEERQIERARTTCATTQSETYLEICYLIIIIKSLSKRHKYGW